MTRTTVAEKTNEAPVLITDGETRAALAIVRSLGRAGYVVHVTSRDGRSLAGASRFCQVDHATGDVDREPHAWASHVERLASSLAASVLPVTEVSIGSLFAADCDARLDLIAPPRADYEAAIDKHGLLERARRLGIDVPETSLVECFGALDPRSLELRFPLVAKPRRSRLLSPRGWLAPPVMVIRNESELAAAVGRWQSAHGDILLQEFVPGHGEALFALCEAGSLRARFAHRRLREKPPTGGVSVLRESMAIPVDIGRASERLLADLRFTGVAMVEYRRSPEHRVVLMEINPRPWGSLQLAIDAGLDFPRRMVEGHRGRPATAPEPHPRLGVRTRWLLGDVDHWLTCARSRALREELGTSLLRLGLDFLRSFVDGTRLEVLRADDPRPFFRELRQWLRALRAAGTGNPCDPTSGS